MISTKGRYALRVMIDLAENYSDDPIPLKEIAERQEISKKYLEAIMKELVTAKLVKGTGGKGGGYRLCRPPESYNVWEILKATEGDLACVACLSDNGDVCPRIDVCRTISMWQEYDKMKKDYFSSKMLTDFLNTENSFAYSI